MTTSRYLPAQQLSRRGMLRLLGGGTAAALLGSCGGDSSNEGASDDGAPTPDAVLPTEDITFRWIDSGDVKADFLRQYFEEYQQDHSNITIEYDPLPWPEIGNVVPLGVQNNNAHDVFALPQGVTGAQAVREGWVAPLDDLIPDLEEWKARLPAGILVEGINMFDGQVYGFPIGSGQRYFTLLYYNVEYMNRVGYDLTAGSLTWDAFREAARKITEDGGGEYHGFIIGGGQVGRWAVVVSNLAQMAGSATSIWNGFNPFDFRTGEFTFTTDQHVGAVELLLAMKDDGSISPDSVSISVQEAGAMMPNGAAGMILGGPWYIPDWQRNAPQFDFGVASQPVPNDGSPAPLSVGPGGSNTMWVYSGSLYQQVAGELFANLGSEEGQRAWAEGVGVADPPALTSVFDDINLDVQSQKAAELFEEQLRIAPEPALRNPEVEKVRAEWQAITPDFGETIQGIYVGQLDDVGQALKDVQDRYNAELDRAIAAARDRGAEVSRDDWIFPNWDPTAAYTSEHYDNL